VFREIGRADHSVGQDVAVADLATPVLEAEARAKVLGESGQINLRNYGTAFSSMMSKLDLLQALGMFYTIPSPTSGYSL